MKSFIIILLFQFLILIVVSQPVNKLTDVDDITNYGVHRYPRTLVHFPPCKMNQYFDKEKGFCLNVLGGGKALYINNTSCGTNVLKPHCYNPRYYYICKRNKTILAQCSQNKHFEVHLQKCTLIYHGKNIPNKTNSNSCERVGVFPIPNDCHQFYTCTAYGHRMKQNFYICPRNMAFDTKTEMCKPSKTCKESRLSSTCLFSSEKEEMTLEEANMFLRPMDQKEKSLTCETIFTNDEETITTERNYNNNEIKSTTTSYNKPSISKFTEPSDRNFTTTIERASETSHSTNTIASEIYTTAIYSPANEEITYTTEQNLSTEIKKNGEENLDSSTSKESYKQEHNGKTDNDNVQSTDAMKIFSTEPTILNDTISTGTGSETQSDIEIKTPPNELPNFENQHSTTTAEFNDSTTHHWYVSHNTPATKELGEPLNTEKEIIDLPSAKKNNNNNSDVEEPEINLNDPSSEFINITPNIEIPNTTPATDDLNEPLTIDEEITDLPSITIKSNLDEEEYTKINSNDPPSEIPNITQPNIKIPNSTPVTEDLNEPTTEKEIIDLSSATINDNTDVEKPEINLNDPEFLNATQPNIEIPNSTPVTEDLNELLATEKEIIDLPPAINDNPDVEKPEINLNDPEFLNATQPNIEIPNNTPATEYMNEPLATEKEIIDLLPSTTDTITNSNPDVEEHTESEITSNDPSSEIPNITQPNIEIPYSTAIPEDLNEPTTEKEIIDLLSSTTDTITYSNPDIQRTESEITSNNPSSEISNITQPNLDIPYSTPATEDLNESTTEKEIIDLLPSTTDKITNSNPDVEEHTESEVTSNDPSSEIPNITQPNIEIPYSIPATEDLNEPATEKEIIDLSSATINDNPDVEKPEINLNDPEFLNTTQPNIEIPNSTPVTEDLNESVTEKEIIDLLSSTTDTIINSNPDVEEHTELEITSNDPSSEIPNITQPNIDISYSTPATEDLNEPTTEKEIIDLLPSTTDTITNSNPDIQQTESEITSNDPSSEIPNITQPNIEIPYSTPATEDLNEPATEKEIIDSLSSTTDRITNSNPDIQQTESEITSNDPLSGILNTGEHNIEIPNSTPVTIKSNKSIEKENSDFISIMTNNDSEVENKKKIDINLNDPLSEILVTGIPNTEIEHSIVTTIKVTEYSTFESESSDTVSEIPFNTLTSIKENDTVINVSDPSMEITTPSLENIVTNGEETFMKISNNDRTENNIFAESVTDAMESSSISENINNNFQSYVSPISVNPASYSSMISENKVEEPTSIPITDRIALNKNEENNTPSIEFNMKTNSPTEINTKYTTISINKKLDNIGNEKLTLSSDTDISETDKSISQTNKLTTSFRDLIAKCKNHMSAETTTQSTKLNPSNEKYSDPFHMQSHSLVSDKKNANKQNKIFEEEEDSLWKRIYSGKTISKNFILPITSAVLNFVDKFECYLKNTLIKIFH